MTNPDETEGMRRTCKGKKGTGMRESRRKNKVSTNPPPTKTERMIGENQPCAFPLDNP
ncbi:hypothetical protein [Paenibacillus lactis]|uniref:hypothetical protein n=1 Tax=Paenibacillus lactis TaxID=228574 RepID=UPI0012FCFA05